MKNYPYIPSMVQAITVLTVLKMMTKAQTTCGSGPMSGKLLYERLPNIQLQNFDDDVVRDTLPPFAVLEKCQEMCIRDRSSQNIVRFCASFDFQPGSRIATFSGDPQYEESTCYMTAEQSKPEGLGTLILAPNSIHFTEVCITSNRPDRECPNRRYVFERHPRKRLKLPTPDIKEMTAGNRSECEDKCLNEFSFVCRSATFDSVARTCSLSRFTRRTHPELLQDDPDSDYLENTCLNAERRCDGLAVFIKEENKRLGGPFEVDMFSNLTLEDCQAMCVRAEKYLCRSIEYDEMTKQCSLSEEDSISQKDEIGMASSPTHHFYDFVCLDSPRGTEYPDNSVTSHLFTEKPDTAFQRYRNSRLTGEHQSEISDKSLSECLDECLRQPSFQCRSAEYSERYRTCRLTRYNQRDGMRIIYDADYDYYENLMLGGDDGGSSGGGRPGDGYQGGGYRPGGGGGHGSKYPPGRRPQASGSLYPPVSGGGEGEAYDNRLPPRRPPFDEYNHDDRLPNRYPPPRRENYPVRPANYPDDYPRYPPPYGGGALYPRPSPSAGGGHLYPDRYGGGYNDYYNYKLDNMHRDRIYELDRYPPGVGDPYLDQGRYDGVDDDRFNSRYGPSGGRLNNRFGGSTFTISGTGTRYPSRPEYDDRDADRRFFYRPGRRPVGRPVEGRPPLGPPFSPHRRPYSPGPDGPIYDDYNGIGAPTGPLPLPPGRPYSPSRCDETDNFKQMGARQRVRKEFVRRVLYAPSLLRCEQECNEERGFICRSFNYREGVASGGFAGERDNCELSDRDSRELEMGNAQFFDTAGNYDFYERALGRLEDDCLDVSQVCNEDGMEFTLRTPEGFYGRIYTYGFYDRCFFRGNGGSVSVLRISGAQGYPECGTQRYGDSMTNIVVVQFSDYVQTSKDKRFNLTCLFRGPGEAVVSSGFIGAAYESGSPIPIEYLPAENTLSSKVRLMILYQGRPTTTIAVGDPLTFRIEAQDGYNYVTDIFATNVVARDPYTGRSVQLIDQYGCPIDSFVFPELDKGRNGDTLEARFNAFKIPESNFLVFEATVRTCRDGCQPAYCPSGSGRSEPSFGRRRRSLNDTTPTLRPTDSENSTLTGEEESVQLPEPQHLKSDKTTAKPQLLMISSKDSAVSFLKTEKKVEQKKNSLEASSKEREEEPEFVREMIEVFDSREEMPQARIAEPLPEVVCLSPGEYHGLIGAVFVLVAILLTASLLAGLAYRKYWVVMRKNMLADRVSSSNFSSAPSYPTTRSSAGLSQAAFGTISLQKPFANFRPSNFPSIIPKTTDPYESQGAAGLFEDPSEPIYTDPSLFERSRSLRSIAVSPKRRRSPDQQQ